MRPAVLVFSLLVVVPSTFATRIARQNLPNCAAPCLTNANAGTCAPANDTCLCKNQTFVHSTTTCIETSCYGNDLQNAEAFVQQLCLAVGVTLTTGSVIATSAMSPFSGSQIASSISVFAGAAAALAISTIL